MNELPNDAFKSYELQNIPTFMKAYKILLILLHFNLNLIHIPILTRYVFLWEPLLATNVAAQRQ